MKLSGKKIIQYILLLIIASGLGYGIWYSVGQYQLTQENITVCGVNGCIRTMHIHSDIHLTICGQKFDFPRETGPLSGLHTHKEKNYLHFHDKIPLVSGENELEFDKRLSLREIFENFPIDVQGLCGKKLEETTIEILVNGIAPADGLDYMWSDHEELTIVVKK